MGFVRRLGWVNKSSKKQCKRFFWRVRSAVKKAVKNVGKQHEMKFQYDPWSYALNFDDGSGDSGNDFGFRKAQQQKECFPESKMVTWVFIVFLVESSLVL